MDSSIWTSESRMGVIRLGEYHAVLASAEEPVIWHRPLENVETGYPVIISANAAGLNTGDKIVLRVDLFIGQSRNIDMEEII